MVELYGVRLCVIVVLFGVQFNKVTVKDMNCVSKFKGISDRIFRVQQLPIFKLNCRSYKYLKYHNKGIFVTKLLLLFVA